MKGEEWKNAWPEVWEIREELDLPRTLVGKWVHKHPIDRVAEAMRAARGKRDPVSYVVGVLRKWNA